MSRLLSLFRFLRLTDETDKLSLTNLGLMVVLLKVGMSQQPSIADLGALMSTLLLYAHKKVLAHKKAGDQGVLAKVEALAGELTDTKAKLQAVDNRTKR